MAIADETAAFTKWISNPCKWMKNSVYAYYDLMFNASQRAVKGGRRSRVSKQSVVNATRNFFIMYQTNGQAGLINALR